MTSLPATHAHTPHAAVTTTSWPTLPALLAGGAEPGSVPLVVHPAGLADVVVAVAARALGVEQEREGRAAADAAALVEATLT